MNIVGTNNYFLITTVIGFATTIIAVFVGVILALYVYEKFIKKG